MGRRWRPNWRHANMFGLGQTEVYNKSVELTELLADALQHLPRLQKLMPARPSGYHPPINANGQWRPAPKTARRDSGLAGP